MCEVVLLKQRSDVLRVLLTTCFISVCVSVLLNPLFITQRVDLKQFKVLSSVTRVNNEPMKKLRLASDRCVLGSSLNAMNNINPS